ncbi:fumarylacetoacetate hydrolase family protein [Sediminibacillus massiliensis]|uniref:fumarylacetoacetate hydrolase family protein n=1 Tax=Sediminibacillus massiliensis TaxID=1926277 RepID=UPI0009887B9B|nr:fumarylacetoacetate hydrolase family protein [Sediminibacillus massiliensis]
MLIISFNRESDSSQLAAVTNNDAIYPLPFDSFVDVIRKADEVGKGCLAIVEEAIQDTLPLEVTMEELDLELPVNAYEVWASGVTYLKSKDARNYEAYESKEIVADSYYDKVYEAERPEIFLKSTERRTIGPNQPVYLRTDSKWQIPEPELGLVINKHGKIVGYTIGNDMSSRDIEGENPLYLPQAKIWKNSCSIGPAIRLAETVDNPYDFEITCRIFRNGEKLFEDTASTSQLKRKYEELVSFLIRDNEIFDGTVLLTGTCIVPDNDFTLHSGDEIEMEVPGIGVLRNPVKKQATKAKPILGL